MRSFEVPYRFKSDLIGKVKEMRKNVDPRKKDFSPSILDFGTVRFHLARHFGFCYGVENAIEIAYQAIDKYPNKRIFFLSEMIHNPTVNTDLKANGINFIMTTKGEQLVPWESLTSDDVILIPAFGTTLAIKEKLKGLGVLLTEYDTTCPFVVKVWNRAEKLGEKDFTIIIHGKPSHEETRATFSHSANTGQSIVVKDMEESIVLGEIILGKRPMSDFEKYFQGRTSKGFLPEKHLKKVGVVNQTTMLAEDTRAIADYFKNTMAIVYDLENIKTHFADTRDTLCYATNDNQQATYALLEKKADFAIVVGGYNSSNTTHLVELCEQKLPTYFIEGPECLSATEIKHFDIHKHEEKHTKNYLPTDKEVFDIILTSGASCPDALVEEVLQKLLMYFDNTKSIEAVLEEINH